MRSRILALFVAVLVCSFSVAAQAVIESASKVAIEEKAIVATLVVESEGHPGNLSTSVELLDTVDLVRAQSSEKVQFIQSGRQALEFRLQLPDNVLSNKESIAWYRLRYRIGDSSGLISMSQLIKDFFDLRVIASDYILAGMTYRVRVRAVNPVSSEPVSGVMIHVVVDLKVANDEQKFTLNGSGVTGTDGFAVVDLVIPAETKLDDDGEIRVTGRKDNIVREAEEDLNTQKDDILFLTMTDKPIYQPEQTVNIRGILMKGFETQVVVPNSEVEFTVEDDDNTVLYREKVRSSEFGVASMSWKVPTNAKLGDYRIKFGLENDEEIGGENIRVSRYDLPNFVVGAKAQKPYYLPDENEAEVEVRADYLFGKPVTSGKIRVVQENSRKWNWEKQKYDIEEGQVREGVADAEGKFTATMDLREEHVKLKDEKWQNYHDIRFAAYFTDLTTNKTEQRRFDIRITREPIHVYLIGETYERNPRLPVRLYVSTFYADGAPAECDVEIRASEESEKKFKTYARLKTNQYGAGKFSIPRPKIGDSTNDLDFVVIARDKDKRNGTFEKNISFDDDDEQIHVATDRSIYKPGETMNVTITSSIRTGPVYLDVVNDLSVIDSSFAVLQGGKAEIQIPYNDTFKGELTIAAFTEDADDDMVRASIGVIFPAKQGINVDASFDKALYKPGEEATVNYGVIDALGQPIRSALGIAVLDKAVEERASTDESFGGRWRSFSRWLGYGKGFGGFNVKDLKELDLTKPISKEMQLVGRIILHDQYYHPGIFHSNNYYDEARAAFGESTKKQFAPVDAALRNTYESEKYLHPVDDVSLDSILRRHKIDFGQMLDPWENVYRAKYSVEKGRDIVTVRSAGPDKQFETEDDFTAFTAGFDYFLETGNAIDAAVRNYNARTGAVIRNEKTLFTELGISELLDRFGRPYKIVFEGDGRLLKLRVLSGGHDGKLENTNYMRGDDFQVWTSQIDFFTPVEMKISNAQRSVEAPMTEAEFRASLRRAGVDHDDLLDGNGNPLYITVAQTPRYWSKAVVETFQKFGESKRTERMVSTPVTQQIITFTIRSNGRDATTGTYDDFTLMQVVHVLSERLTNDPKPASTQGAHPVSTDGSISGVVKDAAGAVIPNITVIATNDATKISSTATTDDSGKYLIANLVAGTYTVNVPAVVGFNASTIANVAVAPEAATKLDIVLSVGSSSVEVSVAAGDMAIDTTSSRVETTITSQTAELLPKGLNFSSVLKISPASRPDPRSGQFQIDGASGSENTFIIDGRAVTNVLSGALEQGKANSTPRLREYFPETLFWAPEVVTDPNGKAAVKFKMADSITTWKMYTIASTKNGQIGVAEKEVAVFQPFFADLDPPKFLTEGDEIFLPSQVRNYTSKKQKVDVTMDKAAWFSMLSPEKQQIDVEQNGSTNAVFGFKAITAIKDGKQRVTAIAQTDSDAIEKPVTVRPNGQEVVRTDTRVTSGTAAFDVQFPANALPRTQQARLKIYPDLFAQVTDSVEGLLQRPYGCGEQTISSTYPNLMILKFTKTESPLRQKAKRYLQAGYERLLGYQDTSGGFSYWGGKNSSPDLALTAYAMRFLNDAQGEIEVDNKVIERVENWLRSQQRADGSWTKYYGYERSEDSSRNKAATAYVVRSLAMRKEARNSAAIQKALAFLRSGAASDDAYGSALIGLSALDVGDTSTAAEIAKQLERSAEKENDTIFWKLTSSTLFYGSGRAGNVETTALVLQLMMRTSDAVHKETISKALAFLFRNKDRYGVWHSTQATINVLEAFLIARAAISPSQNGDIQISLNGRVLRTVPASNDIVPIDIDISPELNMTNDRIEIATNGRTISAQLVLTHYIDWQDSDTAKRSSPVQLDYHCDKLTAAIMEETTCTVEAARTDGRYGMLLAEIGTPPGADVSRESLEKASADNWSIGHYDILPDRIVLYLWAWNKGTKFNFKFKPRYGINAQTPASTIYDYYDPDAQATVAPLKFVVRGN